MDNEYLNIKEFDNGSFLKALNESELRLKMLAGVAVSTTEIIGAAFEKSSSCALKASFEFKAAIDVMMDNVLMLESNIEGVALNGLEKGIGDELSVIKSALEEQFAIWSGLNGRIEEIMKSFVFFSSQLSDSVELMDEMRNAGGENSDSYRLLSEGVDRFGESLRNANEEMEVIGGKGETLNSIISVVNGVSGVFSACEGALGLFGQKSKELAEIQNKLNNVLSILNGVQQLSNVINEVGALKVSLMTKAKVAWAAATEKLNIKLSQSAVLSKVLASTGVVFLISGISVLVSMLSEWIRSQNSLNESQKAAAELSSEIANGTIRDKMELQSLMKVASDYDLCLVNRKKAIENINSIMPESNAYLDQEGRFVIGNTKAWGDYIKMIEKISEYKVITGKIEEYKGQLVDIKSGLKDDEFELKGWEWLKGAGKALLKSQSGFLGYGDLGLNYLSEMNSGMEKNKAKVFDNLIKSIDDLQKRELELLKDDGLVSNILGGGVDDSKSDAVILAAKAAEKERKVNEGIIKSFEISVGREFDNANDLLSRLELIKSKKEGLVNSKDNDVVKDGKRAFLDVRQKETEDEVSNRTEQIVNEYGGSLAKKRKLDQEYTQDKILLDNVIKEAEKSNDYEMLEIYKQTLSARNAIYNQQKDVFDNPADENLEGLKQKFMATSDMLLRIKKQYDDDIKILDDASNGDAEDSKAVTRAKQRAQKERDARLSELSLQMFQEQGLYESLFNNLDSLSQKEIKIKIKEISQKVDDSQNIGVENGGISTEDADKIRKSLYDIKNSFKENPFSQFISGIKDLDKNADKVAKKNALGKMMGGMSGSFDIAKGALDSVAGALKEFNIGDENTEEILSGVSGLLGGASQIASGIASGNPLSIIQGTIQFITNAINLFDFKNRQINADIKKTKDIIEDLNKAYAFYELKMIDAYGAESDELKGKMLANKESELEKTRNLLELEQSRTRKDKEKIAEYEKQIMGLEMDVAQMRSDMKIEIMGGVTIKSFGDDLANSLIGAFQAGEDAAAVFATKTKDLIVKALSVAFSKRLQDIWADYYNLVFDSMADGVITEEEQMKIDAEGNRATIRSESESEMVKKQIDRLGMKDDSVSAGNRLSSAVKGVTEETAGLIGGYMNAIRVNQTEQIENIRAMLLHTSEIAFNTRYIKSIDDRLAIMMNGSSLYDSVRAQG